MLCKQISDGSNYRPCLRFEDENYKKEVCKVYPIHISGIVGPSLKNISGLLEKGTRIVYLTRDPRAIIWSRKNDSSCWASAECTEANFLCNQLIEDYKVAKSISINHPNDFRYNVINFFLDIIITRLF